MTKLLFTSGSGVFSWLIKKFSGQGVSHVGIQIKGGDVISAEKNGVVRQNFDEFMKDRKLVCAFAATPLGEPHLMVSRALAHMGDKYGFDELPGFIYSRIVGGKNPTHDPHKEVCSEFILFLDDETGFVTEFSDLDPEKTTPGDLVERLRKGGPTFREVDVVTVPIDV